MAIYRITIVMPDGSRGRCNGLFADIFEAVSQTSADFPEAREIGVEFVGRVSQ